MKEEIKDTGKTLIQEFIISLMKDGVKELSPFLKKYANEASKDKKKRNIKYNEILNQIESTNIKLIDLEVNKVDSLIIIKNLRDERSSISMLNFFIPLLFNLKEHILTTEIRKWEKMVDKIKFSKQIKITHEINRVYNSKNESTFFDGYPNIINAALESESKSQINKLILETIKEQG